MRILLRDEQLKNGDDEKKFYPFHIIMKTEEIMEKEIKELEMIFTFKLFN